MNFIIDTMEALKMQQERQKFYQIGVLMRIYPKSVMFQYLRMSFQEWIIHGK